MKKITVMLATVLAASSLVACGGKDGKTKIKNVSGGTDEEREAIQKCASGSICQLSGNASIAIGDTVTDLLEDNGDFLKVTTLSKNTKVSSGKKYTVTLEWAPETDSQYFGEVVDDPDGLHQMIIMKYPGKSGEEGTFSLALKSISCGGASSTDTGVVYKFNVKKATYAHKDVTISQLNALKSLGDGKYGYNLVDYETNKTNAYFYTIPENEGLEKDYYYVNCVGKVIYYSPDGNWGLIADGDQIMEIYAGSALDIAPKRYPAMKNEYVKVVGNMSQYLGNIQIGYITDMLKASASDLENGEPTMKFEEITATDVSYISYTNDKDEVCHKQCVYGANLSNALKQVTGKYVPGSIKIGKAETETAGSESGCVSSTRFSFKLDIGGGVQVRIAYDYHVDKDGELGIAKKIKELAFGENNVTIKGTLRFNGSDSMPFNQTGGEWELVPFAVDHISAAAE